MKRNVRKVFALSLSALMMAGSLPAYAAKTEVASSGTVTKPDKITFMVNGTFISDPENGQEYITKAYKELTGIELVLNKPSHNEYAEKVNLAFTSGQVPDALILSSNDYMKFASYGALYDITKTYENSQAKKNIINQGFVDTLRIDGKLYGLPNSRGNGCVTYVRGDWMDKLKLEMPTTYFEFIDMLKAFRDNDPDGNGKKDTIPYTGAGLVNNEYPLDIYLREFYQDATPDFKKKGDKWVDGMTEPEMKQALLRTNVAFKEGLIDKEIVTNTTLAARTKFMAGNTGTFNYWAGVWNNTLQSGLVKAVATGKAVPIPGIKGAKYVERPAVPISITTKAKNPEAVYKYLLELMVDEGAGQKLFEYGQEGTMYKIENGKFTWLPQKADPKVVYNKALYSPELGITHMKNIAPVASDLVNSSMAVFDANSVVYSLLPGSSAYNSSIGELNNIRTATVSNIVYGKMTVDEGLADYTKKAKLYVDAILKDFNKAK